MAFASIGTRFPATGHHDFRALWGGTAASSVALWTLLLGNAWVVYHLSGSSFWVGVSTFASMSPYLLAPFGGVIADRVERKYLVRVTRLGAISITALLFTLAATGALEVWMVVGLALCQGLVRAVEIPADQALLANVVPASALSNAVALTSMTQHGSRAVGPLLAGPLLATIGVEGAYAVSLLFAGLSFISISRVRTSSRGGVTTLREVAGNLAEGLSYVRHSGPVLAIFMLVTAHCALTMSFDAMLPGFAETRLHSPSAGFTLMTLGVGVGALVGTFVLAVLRDSQRGTLLLATAFASGLAPILMSASMALPMATFSAVLMGSSQAMFMAVTAVLLQQVIPDAVRGRVMSLYLMSAGGIMAFANLGFGSAADATGAPVLFLVPAVVFLAIVAVSAGIGGHLKTIYRTGVAPGGTVPAPVTMPAGDL